MAFILPIARCHLFNLSIKIRIMKKKTTVTLLLCVFFMFTGIANASTFIPINISSFVNTSYTSMANGLTFPAGYQVFDEKPFLISRKDNFYSSIGDNIWSSHTAASYGDSTVAVHIPVHVFGVKSVYTLMSSWWGEKSEATYASIEFFGSEDAYLQVQLDGNKHIRDYNNNPLYTNQLDPNFAKEVWTNNLGQRIDMQSFDLPDSFNDETLISILLIDRGNVGFQRTFIGGITVATVPLPGAIWLLFSGLIGLYFSRRKH